jgi:hypothetical protein
MGKGLPEMRSNGFIRIGIAIAVVFSVSLAVSQGIHSERDKAGLETRVKVLESRVSFLENKITQLEKQISNPPVKIIPCK